MKGTDHKLERQVEVLRLITPTVEKMMNRHVEKRKLWFSSDFLPSNEKSSPEDDRILNEARKHAKTIPDSVRASLVMNTITEEGLPHFHRFIAFHLGDEPVWRRWNFMWTAEEDRHGNVLRDYIRDTRLFDFRKVEQLQYDFIEAGFDPFDTRSPYQTLVYTSLQERATQVAHRNTGKQVGDREPLLNKILARIASEEALHYNFYRRAFREVLACDPNLALEAILKVMPSLNMPGIRMPGFRPMAELIRRTRIYGLWEYKDIVEEAISYWQIEVIKNLNDLGHKAQDTIMELPRRIQTAAEHLERRSTQKAFSLDVIYNRIMEF